MSPQPSDRTTLLDLLDQEEWWRTRDGEWIRTEDISFTHLRNLIHWLEVWAERILLGECLVLDRYLDDAPDGAWYALQPALHELEEADALDNLNNKLLMKRLRSLVGSEFK